MKQFLKDYFTFNRRQRNGVFILLSIICLLIVCINIAAHFVPKEKVDFSQFKKEIAEFESNRSQQKDSLQIENEEDTSFVFAEALVKETSKLFPFNPNDLPEEQWKQLGLSDKQIRVIKNYESKGGKFYKKEDLKKMYGISETLYASLESYVKIPQREKFIKPEIEKIKTPLLIELNSADSSSLIKLNGIGAAFASRIIKYRNRLGGFIKKEQLMEVYGLDTTLYNKIENNITVDLFEVNKININTVTTDEMKMHPYVKYNIANSIINYRKQHGNYKEIAEIKNSALVNDELYRKLAPYLTVK